MTEDRTCVTCKTEEAVPYQDECSPCYLAPFGTAWEEEMMERMQEGGW